MHACAAAWPRCLYLGCYTWFARLPMSTFRMHASEGRQPHRDGSTLHNLVKAPRLLHPREPHGGIAVSLKAI